MEPLHDLLAHLALIVRRSDFVAQSNQRRLPSGKRAAPVVIRAHNNGGGIHAGLQAGIGGPPLEQGRRTLKRFQ
ncbi:MAG: hypothetical protein ACC667_10190, partial [Longimicrobiales bacterium]